MCNINLVFYFCLYLYLLSRCRASFKIENQKCKLFVGLYLQINLYNILERVYQSRKVACTYFDNDFI